jgi:spore coat protein U-like protein
MQTMKRVTIAVAAAVFSMGVATQANAGSATANLSVTASVAANCTISTTAVAFGPYDPVVTNAASALTGSGTVVIACTKGSAPTIGLGLGSNASGSTRRMAGGGDFLTYELYFPTTNAASAACGALTTVWGTSGANLFAPTSPANTAARTYNVCGSVAGGQNVTVASYSDLVVATVNF